MAVTLVAGDTGSTISVTAKRANGTVIDLTGYAAAFTFKVNGLLALKTVAMTVQSPASDGVVTYQFLGTDLPTQVAANSDTCILVGEVQITDGGGNVLTSVGPIVATIRNRLV